MNNAKFYPMFEPELVERFFYLPMLTDNETLLFTSYLDFLIRNYPDYVYKYEAGKGGESRFFLDLMNLLESEQSIQKRAMNAIRVPDYLKSNCSYTAIRLLFLSDYLSHNIKSDFCISEIFSFLEQHVSHNIFNDTYYTMEYVLMAENYEEAGILASLFVSIFQTYLENPEYFKNNRMFYSVIIENMNIFNILCDMRNEMENYNYYGFSLHAATNNHISILNSANLISMVIFLFEERAGEVLYKLRYSIDEALGFLHEVLESELQFSEDCGRISDSSLSSYLADYDERKFIPEEAEPLVIFLSEMKEAFNTAIDNNMETLDFTIDI